MWFKIQIKLQYNIDINKYYLYLKEKYQNRFRAPRTTVYYYNYRPSTKFSFILIITLKNTKKYNIFIVIAIVVPSGGQT